MACDFLTESGDLGFLGSEPLRDAGKVTFSREVRCLGPNVACTYEQAAASQKRCCTNTP